MNRELTEFTLEPEEVLIREEERKVSNLAEQALWVMIHTMIALDSWAAMMVFVQKIYLTFFSPTEDRGLIDNEGRLIGIWPAAAFIGYGIGARLALKKKV